MTTRPICTPTLPRRRLRRGCRWVSNVIGRPAGTNGRARTGSAEGLTVLQATLGPERVEPSYDLQRRALPDIAFENLAVIADVLDDAIDPIVGQAERLAVLTFRAEHAPRLRIVGFQLLIHIRLVHAKLLGVDHGEMSPANDICPLVVAMTNRGTERLLGNNLRQHDVLGRLGPLQA